MKPWQALFDAVAACRGLGVVCMSFWHPREQVLAIDFAELPYHLKACVDEQARMEGTSREEAALDNDEFVVEAQALQGPAAAGVRSGSSGQLVAQSQEYLEQ
jgi:hypothetical protein